MQLRGAAEERGRAAGSGAVVDRVDDGGQAAAGRRPAAAERYRRHVDEEARRGRLSAYVVADVANDTLVVVRNIDDDDDDDSDEMASGLDHDIEEDRRPTDADVQVLTVAETNVQVADKYNDSATEAPPFDDSEEMTSGLDHDVEEDRRPTDADVQVLTVAETSVQVADKYNDSATEAPPFDVKNITGLNCSTAEGRASGL